MSDPIPECDRTAYNAMVLNVVALFSPDCTDYQIWRGIGYKPLGIKYSMQDPALSLAEMESSGLLTKELCDGHNTYRITLAGDEWLRKHADLLSG